MLLPGKELIIEIERAGQRSTIRSHFLVDASGPRGFLHRTLGLGELPFNDLPLTQGLYTHFTNVKRWSDLALTAPGLNRAAWADDLPPYPVDDAALHHIFEGGWIWVLRFNNGLTSAGVQWPTHSPTL
jgi:FADH2 O2-dependent halogenase